MPVLQVPSTSIQFFYLDSGRPNIDDYTTLIISHGHTFHSGVFRHILPLAPAKGLRIIAINRRDYSPTTEFTIEELVQASSADPLVREAFMEARGKEFALFTSHLIEELELPPPSEDGTSGGVAWMGWSLGNTLTISALSATLSLPDPTKFKLLQYVRRHVIYDCPNLSLGIPQPPKGYIPLLDEMIPMDQRGPIFADWVSSYFDHGNMVGHDYETLEYRAPNKSRKGTVAGMSEEELAISVDYQPGPRSEYYLLTTFQSTYIQQTERGLFDPNVCAGWCKSKTWVLYGDSASWHMPYAAWELEKMTKEKNKLNHIHFREIKDANHFLFWDNPAEAIKNFLYCLYN